MVMLMVFVCYTLLNIYLYNKSDNWGFPHKTMVNIALVFGVPWCLIVGAGTFWGYTDQPYAILRMSRASELSVLLVLLVLTSVALSYAIMYKIGYRTGHNDRKQEEEFESNTHSHKP
jgi:hypothetical protein